MFIHNGFTIDDSNLTPAQVINELPNWLVKFDASIAYLAQEPAMAARLQEMQTKGYAISFFQAQNGITDTVTHAVKWNPDLSLIANDSPWTSPALLDVFQVPFCNCSNTIGLS